MRIVPAVSICLLLLFSATFSGATVYAYPSGTTFPAQAINTTGPVQYISLYNDGKTNVTINNVTTSMSVFTVVGGTTPHTVPPNGWGTYQVQFTPTAAKTYNGRLTFSMSGAANQTVNIGGQGINPAAVPTLNTTSMTFSNQPLGANGPSQTLTITNKGTVAVKLNGVTVTQPFAQSGYKVAITIQPGKSFNLPISYVPYQVGTQAGTLTLTYDIAPAAEVSLWGTSVDASSLGVNSYPILPGGVQGGPYQAYLSAAGGQPPYSWKISGTLPSGLTLSNAGVISGTISSSATLQNYALTATVTDSSVPAQNATQNVSLGVAKTTGANCKNTSFNASDGSGALVPIMDLGTNTYLGAGSGGLYANGTNVDDPVHDAYGQGLAASIQPLDSNGNPDPNGKYVLLAVGLSVTQQLMNQIAPTANLDPAKNSHLVVVNGGTGGGTANALITTGSFYETIINNYLPNAGVSPQQVVAVWFLDVDGAMNGTFPSDMTTLQSQYETNAQMMLTKFPNLKIEYVSSIYYTGYSNGVKNLSNEPWTYESGFAVKNMIQDQMNGNANLNYDPAKGPVMAPWMAWGPYLWANGMIPRSDGLVWTCSDLQNDGTHPQAGAKLKGEQLLLNFLKQDDTAAPWFLAPGAGPQ